MRTQQRKIHPTSLGLHWLPSSGCTLQWLQEYKQVRNILPYFALDANMRDPITTRVQTTSVFDGGLVSFRRFGPCKDGNVACIRGPEWGLSGLVPGRRGCTTTKSTAHAAGGPRSAGERHCLGDGGAHSVRRRVLPPCDRRIEHETGRKGETTRRQEGTPLLVYGRTDSKVERHQQPCRRSRIRRAEDALLHAGRQDVVDDQLVHGLVALPHPH